MTLSLVPSHIKDDIACERLPRGLIACAWGRGSISRDDDPAECPQTASVLLVWHAMCAELRLCERHFDRVLEEISQQPKSPAPAKRDRARAGKGDCLDTQITR